MAALSDALVLIGVTTAWTSRATGRLVLVYAVLAYVALHLAAPLRGRIEASSLPEAGFVLQRLAIPLVPAVVVAGDRAHLLAAPVALSVAAILAMRGVSYTVLRMMRERGIAGTPCLIIGCGEVGIRLAGVLQDHPVYGLRPVGFVGDPTRPDLPLAVLGRMGELDRITREHHVGVVIVADLNVTDDVVGDAVRSSRDDVLVYLVPRLAGVGSSPAHERLWGIHLIPIDRAIHRPSSRAAKRGLDLVVASAALLALWPVMLAAAVAIKMTSAGPILFRQQRIGRRGLSFEMLKFRTMEEADGADTTWSHGEDPRVTRVGRLLRRASIDELPQLINVLRGEMSVVGPRPERPHFVAWFARTIDGYERRHRVRPGMTGLAQIHGRCREFDAVPERARFDNDYIDHWSLWGDVVIAGRTLRLLLKGDISPRIGTEPVIELDEVPALAEDTAPAVVPMPPGVPG